MANKYNINKIKLGYYIKEKRIEKNLNRDELAYKIKIFKRALVNIENGYSYPSLITAAKIELILEIDILDFLKNLIKVKIK